MSKTANDFYHEWLGKGENIDGAYGIQCVDGWKIFLRWLGFKNYNEMGYANGDNAGGIWSLPTPGVKKYFTKVTDYRQLRNGDWVVWKLNSTAFPHSHIAMYYNGKCFGLNQGSKVFNLAYEPWVFKSMAGAWRWKSWTTPIKKKTNDEIADEVIAGKWGNGTDRYYKLIKAGYDYKAIQKLVNQKLGIATDELKIGTKVKAIGYGNGSSAGNSNTAVKGITGTITRIISGAKYPYLISDSDGPLGWYKKKDLKII